MLGDFYRDGKGIRRDLKAAAFWYRRAAGQRDTQAMCSLAEAFLSGQGVRRSPKAARDWFKKAALLGDKKAKGMLADIGMTSGG